jgi:MFS family permease
MLSRHATSTGQGGNMKNGRNLKAMTIARIAIAVVPASLILLFLANGDLYRLVAFTLLLGASQGVITIVRGAVPLALFGTKGYGAVLGVIATPILFVNAFSPAFFALLVDLFGWQISLYALFGCAIVTWVAIEFMSRWYEGAQTQGGKAAEV